MAWWSMRASWGCDEALAILTTLDQSRERYGALVEVARQIHLVTVGKAGEIGFDCGVVEDKHGHGQKCQR